MGLIIRLVLLLLLHCRNDLCDGDEFLLVVGRRDEDVAAFRPGKLHHRRRRGILEREKNVLVLAKIFFEASPNEIIDKYNFSSDQRTLKPKALEPKIIFETF